MFGRKVSHSYVKELETDLKKEIMELKLEMEKLKTHINSLRGLFNRKFRERFDDEDIEPEKQNSKKDVIVPI